MATLIKKHEEVGLPLFKNGVSLQFVTVTFPSDVSAKLEATTAGARSPVVVALEAIAQVASIEVIGTLGNTGTTLPLALAALGGDFPTDTYDGTNSESLVEHLEDLVKAAGTHQSVNLGSATVAAGAAFA
jgi:hypothetical protein